MASIRRTISSLTVSSVLFLGAFSSIYSQGTFTDVDNDLGPGINDRSSEWDPSVSSDGLTLYFRTNRPDGQGDGDLYQATRDSQDELFSNVTNLGPNVNTRSMESNPCPSFDGLTLYFTSDFRGQNDLYAATRSTTKEEFGNVRNLGLGLNSDDSQPSVSQNGLALYFSSNRGDGFGGADLYVATRAAVDEPFGNVSNLGARVNSPGDEWGPSISADELTLFFSDSLSSPFRVGGKGRTDIWVTTRAARSEPFGVPVNLNEFSLGSDINSAGGEGLAGISADWPRDGSKLYFASDKTLTSGGTDLWQATWRVREFLRGDCNNDRQVDLSDASCILNWQFLGESAPGCVAATNPNGDNGIDIADAIYLLGSLFLGGPPPAPPFPGCGPGTLSLDHQLGCDTANCP